MDELKELKRIYDEQLAKNASINNMVDFASKQLDELNARIKEAEKILELTIKRKNDIDLSPVTIEKTVVVEKPVEKIVEKIVEVTVKDPTIDLREKQLSQKQSELSAFQNDLNSQKERFEKEKAVFIAQKKELEDNVLSLKEETSNLEKLKAEHQKKWNVKEVIKYVDRVETVRVEVPVKTDEILQKEAEIEQKTKTLEDKERNLIAKEEDLNMEEIRIKKLIKKNKLT